MIQRRAVVFDGCFGILRPGSTRRGVVLCPAFGLEGLTARRAFADLAERLAARGLSTLVFDWAGTGDSLGGDRDPARLVAWKASLGAAIDCLKREEAVAEIALVGLRFGATLAAEVAAARDDVAILVAAAPVVSGRVYWREQQSLARLLRVRADDDPPDSDEDGGFAVAGFFTSDATAADLKTLDLRKAERAPAPRTLVVARDGDVAATELADRWRALGASVESLVFDGYDALLSDPTRAVTPRTVWDEIVTRLADGAVPVPRRPMAPSAPAILDGGAWLEEVLFLGPDRGLFSVLTRPREPVAGPWVILLDAGRNPHVGWGRMTVELARALAAEGRHVLRLDQAGIGDSPARPDGPDEVLYSMDSVADVRSAMDALTVLGATRFVLIGGCSGAHLALHAARADPRVVGLVPINLQRFVWRDGDSLEAAMRGEFRATTAYVGLVRRADTWRRIFSGDIKVFSIAVELVRRIALRFAAAVKSRLVADPAVVWLRELDRRGTRTLFVFGTDDGGRDEFATHVGAEAKLSTRCPGAGVALIERTDHNLGPRDARAALTTLVRGFLAQVR